MLVIRNKLGYFNMFDVAVSEKIILYARDQVCKYNFGQRGIGDGNADNQLTGIIGQIAIQDLLGLPWLDGKNGFDNGVDYELNGVKIDVKTMGRNVSMRQDFVHNFCQLQEGFDVDVLVFASLNRKTDILTVCGYIFKMDLKQKATFFRAGENRTRTDGTVLQIKSDMYEIPQGALESIDSIDDLSNIRSEGKDENNLFSDWCF